ncbi:MATE family efflux transporter [Tessaracoccus sp. MC1756]|uniref:MATE family efflux transporter n=1 Tax=Tessaracoccus sp. MC1756 TaxID=2760311 RepID=UPI0016026581|nr:MATE family efflux transporter [Tessaracoccus sp. MC1756]MBB1508811.1 MATE family efflux transporter [Tessaracoccus sp. MC1756]
MAKNLTVGSPLRLIVLFTLPLLIGNLFQQAYAVSDAIVVGRLLGVDALAAVGASGSLQFLLFGFAIGCSAGLAIPVARAFGAQDLPGMRRAVARGVLISAVVALVITLIGTLGAHTLLTWLGTPEELMPQSTTFLVVLFSGSFATVAFNYLSSVIRALGDSRTPLVFLIISTVLNVVLVIVFIAVLGTGVGGAALATLIAQTVSVLLCLILIWRRMPNLHLHRADWRLEMPKLRESTKLGLTLGFQMSIIAIGAALLQFGINGLGTDAVAAFTAAMRVDQVAVIPLATVGVAMTTYVAQNAGGRQWRRILTGVRQSLLLAMGMALVLGVAIFFGGTLMVRMFLGEGEPQVVDMAHRYLVINAALYAILAVLFVIRHVIQGLGSTMAPTMAGVLELVARGVIGLFVVPHVGFIAVILAAPAAWVAALIPLLIAWRYQHRRLVVAEREAAARALLDAEQADPHLQVCPA